ncbi:hypothetical protein GCM10027578_04600 [Spirosoma luteolum]
MLLPLLCDDERQGQTQAPCRVVLFLFGIARLTMFSVGNSAFWHRLMNEFAALRDN